ARRRMPGRSRMSDGRATWRCWESCATNGGIAMIKFSPSVLASDYMRMVEDIARLERARADWLHLDIMDGLFVPNISFGPALVKAVGAHSALPLDVHLMMVDPDRYVDAFAAAGAGYLTVHYEACQNPAGTLQRIRAAGMKAGVSLKPG